MKIGVLRFEDIDSTIIDRIRENLNTAFPKTTCMLITKPLPTPEEAYDKKRKQYRSDVILNEIQKHAETEKTLDKFLGIVDLDIFVAPLNFVFGEARCPGKAALISLHRLKPEFYGKQPNVDLFVERSTKEAVHELGHTIGLEHCSNPFCVMYFSNSIFETDRKQSLFCNKCYLKVEATLNELGGEH
jgi:archaemetzincin